MSTVALEASLPEPVAAVTQAATDLRRDLHRRPEVAWHEKQTARVVAERLRAAGLEVATGIGGHGVGTWEKWSWG